MDKKAWMSKSSAVIKLWHIVAYPLIPSSILNRLDAKSFALNAEDLVGHDPGTHLTSGQPVEGQGKLLRSD